MNDYRLRPMSGLAGFLLLLAGQAHAATCHVRADAAPGGTGDSWADAAPLQAALADTNCTDVWVARGVYRPTTTADRGISFDVRPGVAVYGGFDPDAGADTFDERVPAAHPTILSGDLQGNDTGSVDGVTPTVPGGFSQGENSLHVVTVDGSSGTPVDADTVLDGFTITAGNANSSSPDHAGAGLYCDGQGAGGVCSPSVRHVTFSGNKALNGGAMLNNGIAGTSNPTLSNVTFSGNSAVQRGGAMYNEGSTSGSSSPTLSNVTFSGNHAGTQGGAMFNGGLGGASNPTLNNVTFSGNSAIDVGGAMYNQGFGGTSSPTLNNVTFSGNHAGTQGGAMFNDGTGGASNPTLRNVVLWGNGDSPVTNSGSANPGFTNSIVQGSGGSGAGWDDSLGTDLGGNLDADPLLAALADNGGFTHTMLPGADSAAIDAGNCTDAPATDQRGVPRPQGAACDIGAVEVVVDRPDGCFVAASATDGDNTGSNWDDAYTSLQVALGDHSCTDIWVARGVYTPTTTADRGISFHVRPGVAVYGGFDPDAGADTFEERDPAAYPTILSGDLLGNDTGSVGGVTPTEPGDLSQGENSLHVVTMDGSSGTPVDADTVVDGFTITAGNANQAPFPDDVGAGLYCDGSGTGGVCGPSVRHVLFSGNNTTGRGGAMFNDGNAGTSSPTLSSVTFSGNNANVRGGAMFNQGFHGTSSPTLSNVSFSGNSAFHGGAMYNNGHTGVSSPSLSNVTFSDNSAGDAGGAMFNRGFNGGVSSPNLGNVVLWGNGDSPVINSGSATPGFTNSIVQGSGGSGSWNSGFGTDGGGNLDADPRLAALADNGGFTHTMLPGAGSAAIDAGSCTGAPATDQRGVPRPQGADCDIGAVEVVVVDRPDGCFVAASATDGDNTGSNWDDAYTRLQDALGDHSCTDIWVARGVYTPTTTADRGISFHVRPGVAMYGGFDPAAGADTFEERDPAAYPTILSGDLLGDDTGSEGGVTPTVPGDLSQDENSHHVVTLDGSSGTPVDADTVLDGFTITAGKANLHLTMGAGLYCDGHGTGGVCSPTLATLVFTGNSAQVWGGAMYNNGGAGGNSSPSLSNVTFSGNRSESSGGAMFNDGHFGGTSSPSLSNVTFSGNSAEDRGSAMYNFGHSGISNPNMSNVTFSGNSSAYQGGAMFNDGGGGGASNPTLSYVTFSGNSAPQGGAMYNVGVNGTSNPTLNNVTFSGNSAETEGGAMFNDGREGASSPSLSNVTFNDNSAEGVGGAMYNRGISGGTSSPILGNVVFWGNSAPLGPQIHNDSATPSFTHSILQGSGGSGAGWDDSLGTDLGGNLDADPLLAALADNGGFTHTMLPGAGSAAIDAGSCTGAPPADQRGIVRPQGADCDIGAVEVRQYTLDVVVQGQGNVSAGAVPQPVLGGVDGCTSAGTGCSAIYGEAVPAVEVALQAMPAVGWHFTAWSGDCAVDAGEPLHATVVLDADRTCSASFALNTYAVTLAVDPGLGGALAASGNPAPDPGAVAHGTLLSLVASPAAGWDAANPGSFPPGIDCGGGAQDLGASLQDDGSLTFESPAIVQGGCTITARFANQAPGFTVPQAAVTVLADGPAVTVPGWATGLRSGDTPATVDQTLQFVLTVDAVEPVGAQLFAVGGEPSIDASGTLRFTPGPDAGSASCSVVLVDDAGIDHGGSDTSLPQSLPIVVSGSAIDLSIGIDLPATVDFPGERIVFGLGIANTGPDAAEDASVQWTPPVELGNVEWVCDPQGTAVCTAAGSGGIDDAVDLPASGHIDYLVAADLPSSEVTTSATVPASASITQGPGQLDADAGNNSVEWQFRIDGLFRDGLEDLP